MKALIDLRIKTIRSFIEGLSFKRKLFILFLVPVILLSFFIGLILNSFFRGNFIDLTEKDLEGRVDLTGDNIDSKISTIVKKVDILSFDNSINKLLYRNPIKPSEKTGMVYTVRNRIIEVLNVEMMQGVTFEIYTKNKSLVENYYIYDFDNLRSSLSKLDLENLNNGDIVWLPPGTVLKGILQKKTIRFAIQPNGYMQDGMFVVVVSIPDDMILSELQNLKNISLNGWACITDPGGNILITWNLNSENLDTVNRLLKISQMEKVRVNTGKSIVFLKQINLRSNYDTLNLMVSIPNKNVYENVDKILMITAIIILSLIMVIFPITYHLLKNITGRLYHFINGLEAMNLDSSDEIHMEPILDNKNDDISRIIKKFNRVVVRMNNLIRDKYASKLKIERIEKNFLQAKYDRNVMELSLLQAQIDPHFLCNIFSSIKDSIKCSGTENVDAIFDSLVRFYRLTVNHGKDVLKVSQELELTKEYIQIQNFIHYGKFTVFYEIDEKVKDYGCIKLLLQPIVENALIHGFKSRKSNCILTVTASLSDSNIVFDISDNGEGMAEEKIREITKKNSRSGFGIRNTMDRIRLFFGAKGKVIIQSVPQEGTDVQIIIPAEKYDLLAEKKELKSSAQTVELS